MPIYDAVQKISALLGKKGILIWTFGLPVFCWFAIKNVKHVHAETKLGGLSNWVCIFKRRRKRNRATDMMFFSRKVVDLPRR
jgi:hypothetical protein